MKQDNRYTPYFVLLMITPEKNTKTPKRNRLTINAVISGKLPSHLYGFSD